MSSGTFASWVTSEIAAVSVVNNADSMVIIQGGVSKEVTIAQLAAKFGGGGGGGAVDSVNGFTGEVELTQDDIPSGVTNVAYTATEQSKLAGIADDAVDSAGAAAAAPVQSVVGLTGAILAAALKTAMNFVKGDVGLGNVDNTSDANKAVSTATQTALDLKINTSTLGAANGTAQLGADSKLRSDQIPASLVGAANYQGAWNATTNSPTLASGTGTKGYYYVVDTAGSTNLDGITDWKVGDWAIFNGTVWEKIDNTDAVISVNGQIGAVTLTTANISESGNLYFTAARAIASALTGFSASAGTVAATDTIVQAFNKVVGNATALAATVAALTTSAISEGSNLYFTAARVRSTVLTGLSTASAAVVTASNTVLEAIGQLQAQLNGLGTLWGNINYLAPVNGTFTILQYAPVAFTVNSLKQVRTTSGSLTLAIKINGTAMTGASAISVTTSPQDVNITAANTMAVGDIITIEISSASGPPANLVGTLIATR